MRISSFSPLSQGSIYQRSLLAELSLIYGLCFVFENRRAYPKRASNASTDYLLKKIEPKILNAVLAVTLQDTFLHPAIE